jgi:hypothetical protein
MRNWRSVRERVRAERNSKSEGPMGRGYLPESSGGLPCPDMEWTIGVCETLVRSVIETHFK